MNEDLVAEAAEAVRAGRLVVLPTDTVYGIAARPDLPSATVAVFEAKGRPRNLQLPVLVPSPETLADLCEVEPRARLLVERFWPGPLTIVLRRAGRSGVWELGGDPETVGVRMPEHPLALAVLERTGPLAVTSANRSGEPTPSTCDEIKQVFGTLVAAYLCDEKPLEGEPSTVVDLAHGAPHILRAGAVPERGVLSALS